MKLSNILVPFVALVTYPSGANGALVAYNVPAPSCVLESGNTVATCTYADVIGAAGDVVTSTLLAYDGTDCYGAAVSGASISSGATGSPGAHVAAVQVTPPTETGAVQFCLKTEVATGSTVWYYQYQAFTLSYTYNENFSLTGANLATTVYDGDVANTADDTVFSVAAYRCDPGDLQTAITGAALALGTPFNICLSSSAGAIVSSITEFKAKKEVEVGTITVPSYDVLTGNSNILGLGDQFVLVSMQLPTQFFTDADPLTLYGSVDLVQGRRLNLRILVDDENTPAEFAMNVEVDAGAASSSPTLASSFGSVVATALVAASFAIF